MPASVSQRLDGNWNLSCVFQFASPSAALSMEVTAQPTREVLVGRAACLTGCGMSAGLALGYLRRPEASGQPSMNRRTVG